MDGLLVLSRKRGETVVIGEGRDAVTLIVIEADHGKCRLGFKANTRVRIDRGEVRERRTMELWAEQQREQREAQS